MPKFTYDCTLTAAFTIDAPNAEVGKAWLIELLDAADANVGCLRHSSSLDPVIGEVSIADVRPGEPAIAVADDDEEPCRKCGAVPGTPEYGTVGDGYDGLCPSCADKEEPWFLNRYRCESCDVEWTDEWDCTCNDKCPSCNREIEPYKSDDLRNEGDDE